MQRLKIDSTEFSNEQFGELIYGKYRIIYRIEKKQTSNLAIRHGRQILPIEEITE